MVACVLDRGWSVEATAERFRVDAKTVRKWRDRFIAEGESGLLDRSSRPHRSRTGRNGSYGDGSSVFAGSAVGVLTASASKPVWPPRRSSRS